MLKALLIERRFSVLLSGHLLSRIGDGVHEFIFIISVLNITNNDITSAGFIYFFRFIPYLILGPVGGALADRFSRKKLMIGSDLARMLITTCMCMLLLSETLTAISIAVIGMLMTSLRAIFQPAFQATIPSIVAAKNLPVVNGAAQITIEIGGMTGPAIGGVAIAAGLSAGQVLILDVLAYMISALCILSIRIPDHPQPGKDQIKRLSLRLLLSEFGENLLEMHSKPKLLVAILYSSACILLAGSALRILIPAMLRNAGHTDNMIGYAMSFIAIGTIVGALLCARITKDFSTARLMLYWSLYGLVLSLLPVSLINPPSILTGCLALGFAGAFIDVVLPTNIQQQSTDQNMGKNFSLFSTLANTGEALSGTLAGLLVLASSVTASVTAIGLLIAAIAWIGKIKGGAPHE